MIKAMLLFFVSTFGVSNIIFFKANEFDSLLSEDEVCEELNSNQL